jgi:hypothetical protein
MNKAEVTTKALTAGLLGAILTGVLIVATEQAVCYDVGINTECSAGWSWTVLLGVPASVFLIIFMVLLRNLPGATQFQIKGKKDDE